MVAGVAGLFEPPVPFFGGAEGFAGDLPIKQIGFFFFAAIGLHADVFVLFADTLDFEYVGLSEWSAIHAFLIQAADNLGHSFRFRVEVSNFESVCRMIEAGVGIGVVPEQAARRYAQRLNINIVRLSDEWSERKLHICVREQQRLPSFARDLVTMLLEDATSAETHKLR